MKHIRYLIVGIFLSLAASGYSQEIALKTNLVTDVLTTPNLGVELGLRGRSTVNLVYGLNPWSFNTSDGKRMAKHWVLQPEYRWWFCSKFNGHFVGVHALGGQFNASNINLPLPGFFFSGENLQKEVKNHRYEAWFAGAGVTYGYQWILSRHWNFEAEIGLGYVHAWYKKYACDECGRSLSSGGANYFGLTKVGLSFLYIF